MTAAHDAPNFTIQSHSYKYLVKLNHQSITIHKKTTNKLTKYFQYYKTIKVNTFKYKVSCNIFIIEIIGVGIIWFRTLSTEGKIDENRHLVPLIMHYCDSQVYCTTIKVVI